MFLAHSAPNKLGPLRDALSCGVMPCSSGIFPVKNEDLILFYGKSSSEPARRIEFASATEAELQHLADACDLATFGRNQEAILDESYRKAGKLDCTDFSTRFDPVACGLIDTLRDMLLEGHDASKFIRAELYKLNVYGPGSFFKAHKDTPRGDNMFASLVIVLPTPHKGGALAFRHGNFEYTFDSAAAVSGANKPCVGFAAFYSDVEHAVTPVETGYRVTFTYNLYSADSGRPSRIIPFASALKTALKSSFTKLLADPTFLPNGGYIGFGLCHEYPVSKGYTPATVKPILKGTDAVLMYVCAELALDTGIQVAYEHNESTILCDRAVKPGFVEDSYNGRRTWDDEFRGNGGKLLVEPMQGYDADESRCPPIDVEWVTPLKQMEDCEPYASYGNEPSMGFMYNTMCLLIAIPEPSKRSVSD